MKKLTKCWRPNWKNGSEYPPIDGTCPAQWAWEFMRRNEEYARDILEINSVFGMAYQAVPYSNELLEFTDQERTDRQEYFENKYVCLFDLGATPPEIDIPPLYFSHLVPRADINHPNPIEPKNSSHVTVRYDLSLPLEAQQTAVNEFLNEALESHGTSNELKPKKLHLKKYPTYLRLIDARFAKAQDLDIANFIYKSEYLDEKTKKTIRDNTKAAIQLQEIGFRQIPYIYTKKPRVQKNIENKKHRNSKTT